ncbi:TPA: DUF4258 domain-containing protein [Candidatus Woesearchaeota archaeon]|nr:DUF4258 domain-containing protein [Candidatus Woesearchaeota archaeon]
MTKHAFVQAMLRGIDPDLIENTIRTGKMTRFGKHGVRFTSGRRRKVICVGEICGNTLKILTVERK